LLKDDNNEAMIEQREKLAEEEKIINGLKEQVLETVEEPTIN
jgi:hypothetical protein